MKFSLIAGTVPAAVAAAAMIATTAVSPAAEPPIKIGVIASYSGPYADYGRQFDDGIALWLSEHGGKLAGRPVEIIKKDAPGAQPDLAKRLAQELVVKDKVNFFAGLDFSPNAYAVGAVAKEAKIPAIVMNASSSAITTQSPFVARVSFTVQQVSDPMARWAVKNGITKVYTVVSDYGPGADSETAFEKAFTAAGGTVVGKVRTPLSNPDFSAYVQRIKDEKPQAVFFFFPSGVLPPAFLKAAKERGLDEAGIKLIATGEATDDSYLEATGDVALGLITSHHYSYGHASEKNKKFIEGIHRVSGKTLRPSYFAVAAYDGMQALDLALAKTGGSLDGTKVMEALKGLAFESPRGPIEIDAATRDIVQTVYIRKTEKVNGELVNVEFDKFEKVKDPAKQ
ncbi:ABC transporter substrate-binding protein [Rhodoplanes sp. TEM]|uniref:ABC transporter substrate-binding protein n=1 Tax=Rhodoplanes tepidamans TaxID=200616 RepID=A0ABT5J326_RHOTP|nr:MULTISPECIES: ABC transporter substrate-binding protein [Rhodoplanes]MDC7784092.1 ABC transporter substrate-binding protein [Rhodoplanes tepidamans]MDC7983187.1 ABC transporter substrate-binding protein [Rhodoplanes sp. TEM]MDQ0356811.1 branched-chain amino acid transport system substrate-binding protein [Rhodoplanes tepidamans]